MTTAILQRAVTASRIAHWLGCLLGTSIVLMFVVFAFGGHEEPPPLSGPMVALGMMLIGYLLAWWSDWLGSFVSLAGFAAFYATCYALSGKVPGGPVFPLCFIPGALCLLSVWLRRT